MMLRPPLRGANLSTDTLQLWVNGELYAPVSGAPSAGCGWTIGTGPLVLPDNIAALKHLRLYSGRLMTASEIRQNAESACFKAARFLRISAPTVLKRMLSIADKIKLPVMDKGKAYEVDELRTFIKRKDKLVWIVYALERESRHIVSFYTGSRTNKTLNVVLKTLKLSGATRIIQGLFIVIMTPYR